jgi:hypothetical protein
MCAVAAMQAEMSVCRLQRVESEVWARVLLDSLTAVVVARSRRQVSKQRPSSGPLAATAAPPAGDERGATGKAGILPVDDTQGPGRYELAAGSAARGGQGGERRWRHWRCRGGAAHACTLTSPVCTGARTRHSRRSNNVHVVQLPDAQGARWRADGDSNVDRHRVQRPISTRAN